MEQGLSFIGVVSLCMVGLWLDSPQWFGAAFVSGVTYLVLRGKKKGWEWKR